MTGTPIITLFDAHIYFKGQWKPFQDGSGFFDLTQSLSPSLFLTEQDGLDSSGTFPAQDLE